MEDNNQNTNQKLIFLGPAVATPKGQYAIKKPAIIGFHSYFMCPKCGRPVLLAPQKEGFEPYPCKHCNTQVIVKSVTKEKVFPKLMPLSDDTPKQKTKEGQQIKQPQNTTERIGHSSKHVMNAKIVWGGLISRKSYVLRDGDNWMGRWDQEEAADIMVKDEYMSRRSARIEVTRQKGEALFKFTVERATNPVKVNGKIIEPGQCIYLNFDDRIEMGNTTFFVKKVKNQ